MLNKDSVDSKFLPIREVFIVDANRLAVSPFDGISFIEYTSGTRVHGCRDHDFWAGPAVPNIYIYIYI